MGKPADHVFKLASAQPGSEAGHHAAADHDALSVYCFDDTAAALSAATVRCCKNTYTDDVIAVVIIEVCG